MAYQVLEVTLISAKDLKRVTLFTKMRVYAVASISGGDPRLPTHRTYADREGGRNPMWHAPLRFTIPPAADPRGLALHVLLRAERAFGDRDVGEVVVPMQDLAAASPPDGGANANVEQRHLSYQVRRPVSGRKRGVLHISYRLSDAPAPPAPDAHAHAHAPPASSKRHHANDAAITAYPLATPRGGAQQYPPYHHPYGPAAAPYGGPAGAYPHHHQYGYGAYGYGAAPYGYGGHGAAPAARSGGGAGMGTTAGLGLLGGLMIGDMIAGRTTAGSWTAWASDSVMQSLINNRTGMKRAAAPSAAIDVELRDTLIVAWLSCILILHGSNECTSLSR